MSAIKERPILFSGPMVNAIHQGIKTQTRRVIKPQPALIPEGVWKDPQTSPDRQFWWPYNPAKSMIEVDMMSIACPYGKPGDRLWVREAHEVLPDYKPDGHPAINVIYKADGIKPVVRWTPSIHMPRWASRLTLEVTDVRVQRLQQIQLHECAEEGASPTHEADNIWDSTDTFKSLWNSINGPTSWDENPWVWAVSFKLLKGGEA